MENISNGKKYLPVWSWLSILIIVGGIVGYVFWVKSNAGQHIPAVMKESTSILKDFSSEELGLSLSYPSAWTVNLGEDKSIKFVSPETVLKVKAGTEISEIDLIISGLGQKTFDDLVKDNPQLKNIGTKKIGDKDAIEVDPSGEGATTDYYVANNSKNLIKVTVGLQPEGSLVQKQIDAIIASIKFIDTAGLVSDWKTYNVSSPKFSFKYPTSYEVKTIGQGESVYFVVTPDTEGACFGVEGCAGPAFVNQIQINVTQKTVEEKTLSLKQILQKQRQDLDMKPYEYIIDETTIGSNVVARLIMPCTAQVAGKTVDLGGEGCDEPVYYITAGDLIFSITSSGNIPDLNNFLGNFNTK